MQKSYCLLSLLLSLILSSVMILNVHSDNSPPIQIVITAIGDCTLGSDVNFGYDGTLPAVIDANNGDLGYIFRGVKHITGCDHLTIANLEGTFTNSNSRYPKKYAFKAPPEYAQILTSGSVEAVNLANNHTYDYCDQGFADTIKALDNLNILWYGAGTSRIVSCEGIKIGLLGYAFSIDDKQLANDIQNLKAKSDIVIVSFHWGEERSYWPNGEQKRLAQLSIDSGASLVLGHHPHVLQGLEAYKQGLIAYSLGNFAFGGNINPSDKRTMLLQVTFEFDEKLPIKRQAKIIPARISSVNWINDYQPTVLESQEKEDFFKWFYSISSSIIITKEGEIVF